MVQTELSGLSISVQFVLNKSDIASKLISEFMSELATVKQENEKLKAVNTTLVKEIDVLEDKVRVLEQYTRRSNNEMSGIHTTLKEDVTNL